MILPSLLLFLLYTLSIHVQCSTETTESYSTTPSTDAIKTTSVIEVDDIASTTPTTPTSTTTENSENVATLLPKIHNTPVNVTYVILPSELYLGQRNLITVRSRQPKTKLMISMNVTGLSETIKDSRVYKLHRLNISQRWYGLDIPYEIPFIFDHEESIWVKMIFNFTHCYKNDESERADDIDDNDNGADDKGDKDNGDDDDDDDDDDGDDVDRCAKYKVTQVVESVQLKQLPIIIIGETDKPLYRPGESVNFRYLALNVNSLSPKSITAPLPKKKLIVKKKSQFQLKDINRYDLSKLENIIYKEIYITDPMDNRVKQWLNISPKKALNLTYPLLNKAIEGKWKIHGVIGRHVKEETLEFIVKQYTLPKFTVSLETPKIFNLHSEYVQYSICAKYTNGPALKGHVKSILCACSEYAWDNEYYTGNDEKTVESLVITRKCPSNGYEVKLRPCIIHNQALQADGCANFNVSTKEFALPTDKYSKWNQISILCAHVEEDSTGSKLYNCLKGDEIKSDQANLKLEFPSVYKSKLPITGRVKLSNYAKNINYSVKISVSEQKWGCYWRGSAKGTEYYINTIPVSSLEDGVIHIPPLHSENSILIEAELLSWDSVSKVYLQIWPAQDKIVTTCPNTVKLLLLSNIRLSDKIIFIESMIRGEHMKIMIPAADKMLVDNHITDDCVDRDDELGHYECTGENPEEIQCLPGWQGENCLVPICSSQCNPKGGLCIKPGDCQCKSGWSGANCDQCVKRENCLHGKCIEGNDCVCDDGWTGYSCDRKTVIYKEISEEANETITTESVMEVKSTDELENSFTSTPPSTDSPQINTKPVRTFYQRRIEFPINGSWGPRFTAIIYIHHQQDNASPEIIATQLTVEQIENCTSNAIALQSKSHKSSIEFSQNVADPGEKIEMTITPQGVLSPSALSSIDQETSCYNTSGKLCKTKGQLSNELCFIRISDTSLDNFQGDKNLINLKSFTEKLIDYAMHSEYRPSIAASTQEAFQAAGFQIGSTYPQPMFVHQLYACPQFSYSGVAVVLADSEVNNNNAVPQPLPLLRNTNVPLVKPRLRDFFPEVWLFQVLPITDLQISDQVDEKAKKTDTNEINESRGIKLNLTVPDTITIPDTITSWRASAYCTTKLNGLWFGEPQTITVNMPFYLEITPPKEMKRGEILHIPVSVQHETTISDIICLNEQETQSEREFEFVLPKNMIKDSLNSYISYSDEVLGPALVNLDKLVRLPTGCGEQNMLKYQRDDGSFSAFGKSDKEGSTWLTAFVIRVFAKAYKLEPTLSIEWENLFTNGIHFLITRQNNESGCFEEHGKVLYSPLQGISGIDEFQLKDILLTSFVSSALFETRPNDAGNKLNIKYTSNAEEAYNNGLKCLTQYLVNLESYDELPTSALVQITHTYTLIQPNSQLTTDLQDVVIKRKQVIQDQFGEKIYWSDRFDKVETNTTSCNSTTQNTFINNNHNIDNIEPRDLESTAYAFLSLNRMNQTVNQLFPIIRWISSKQKSNGGFYSTQDTVLGLEAIAEFAKRLGVYNNDNNTNSSYGVLQISNHVNIDSFKLNDTITLEKRQVINQIELPNLEFKHANDAEDKVIHSVWKLTSNQSIKDCMLVQNTFIYNLPEIEDVKTKFKLSYDIIQKTSPGDDKNCKSAKLVMCLQLNSRKDEKPISTGMLLIRVAMVTGWEPIVDQLNSQLGAEDDSLKMLTINDEQNEISLYFNEFSEEEANELGDWEQLKRCVDVPIHQVYYVQNAKNATITAYEYYTPEESITVTYRLDECREAWPMNEILSTTETPSVTSSESTTITDIPSEDLPPKEETPCPVCIDKVTDMKLLLNDVFNSVCRQSNGIYFLKVHEVHDNTINATITHIIQSNITVTWNTTLQLPDSNQCPCQLIKTHQNLVLLLKTSAEIPPGDAIINIQALNTPVKFISDNEILPILEVAADKKWSDSEKVIIRQLIKPDESTSTQDCKQLPKLIEFMKKFYG
ncbi:unnamed protein product [Trichobilharzia regenti]|nr:unnamed protein product [Trichobilharzia regenti]